MTAISSPRGATRELSRSFTSIVMRTVDTKNVEGVCGVLVYSFCIMSLLCVSVLCCVVVWVGIQTHREEGDDGRDDGMMGEMMG